MGSRERVIYPLGSKKQKQVENGLDGEFTHSSLKPVMSYNILSHYEVFTS